MRHYLKKEAVASFAFCYSPRPPFYAAISFAVLYPWILRG